LKKRRSYKVFRRGGQLRSDLREKKIMGRVSGLIKRCSLHSDVKEGDRDKFKEKSSCVKDSKMANLERVNWNYLQSIRREKYLTKRKKEALHSLRNDDRKVGGIRHEGSERVHGGE